MNYRKFVVAALAGQLIIGAGAALAQDDADDGPKSSWATLSADQRTQVEAFAEDYKSFMHKARTELSFVTNAVALVKAAGFEELSATSPMRPGARYYDVNRGRAMALIVIGSDPLAAGTRIVAGHIDSPRLELKGRPIYESEGYAMFQTNYHGGILSFQWTNIPLALLGHVDKTDGSRVQISVGLDPEDPIFIIPGLAPHVDVDLEKRVYQDVIKLEELDPIVGHIPVADQKNISGAVNAYLLDRYNIEPDDLVSAELALVPAFPPRDVGFDRGLMAIYGQDDRLSGYTAMRAIIDLDVPTKTAIAYMADNEESGNVNNTGASSAYFRNLLRRLLLNEVGDDYGEEMLWASLSASEAVSSDVNPGINPVWPNALEKGNGARQGYGVNFKLYGRGFSPNSEFLAKIRRILDGENIPWQVMTYKVGRGGGGTLGRELSADDVEVVDFGVPVLSIHTPYSISSKVDVYWLSLAMNAFFRN